MKKNIIVVKNIMDWVDNIESQPKSLLEKSVIVYCRVSTVQQIDNGSLDEQQKFGINFYKKQKIDKIDYDNIIVVREEGKSGDDVNEEEDKIVLRPLLSIILTEVKQNTIKYFWSYDTNRVCRSTEIGNDIWKLFRDYKVNFYVGNEKKNVNDLMGKFYWMFMNLVDEIENDKRFYRGLVGKLSSIKRNKFWGGRYQYGYKKGNQNGHLIIDRTQSKNVKKIFELFNNGQSVKDIIIYLNKENILPPKSNSKIWNEGTIKNMLRNETYIGHKEIIVKLLKNESKEKCIELGQFEKVQQKTPKIVDEKIFQNVQTLLDSKKRESKVTNVRKYTFLLNDILYCGICGNKMKSKFYSKQNTKIYYCNWSELNWKYNNNNYKKCGKEYSKSINIDVTDNLVWNEVLRLFKDSYIIKEQFKTKYLPIKLKDRDKPLEQIKSYNKLISECNRKIKQLKNNKVELFGKKMLLEMDEITFVRFENEIDKKIEQIKLNVLGTKDDINGIKQNIKWYDWLKDFDRKFKDIKRYRSLDDKRNFIKKYVSKVEVYWDEITNTHKIEIYFKFYIVKDDRIRKEKYVFKVLNGQNVSVINDINSKKMKYLLNKEKKQTTYERNHSTVTLLAKFLG